MSLFHHPHPQPPPPQPRTVIAKAWIAGTDTGIANAAIFVSHELYERTATCNQDGIAWFLDVPAAVTYFNLECRAVGYLTVNTRVDVGPGAYYIPPIPMTPAIPAAPSRDEACLIRFPFQGLWIDSPTYSDHYRAFYGSPSGQVPFYGGSTPSFWVKGELPIIVEGITAMGGTHLFAPWMHGGTGYNAPNQPYGADQLIPPTDLDASGHRAFIDDIIRLGLRPVFIQNGEGQWGYQNIRDTFEDFVQQMRDGYDRLAYGPVLVSYDGVWPADWSVEQVKTMIAWMRAVLGPTGYLGMMFGQGPAGNAYLWVEHASDWTNPEYDGLDIVYGTGTNDEVQGPSLANKAQYMVRDPNFSEFQPEFPRQFIFQDNSRGRRYWSQGESDIYAAVRDPLQLTKPRIDAARQRQITMNIGSWG